VPTFFHHHQMNIVTIISAPLNHQQDPHSWSQLPLTFRVSSRFSFSSFLVSIHSSFSFLFFLSFFLSFFSSFFLFCLGSLPNPLYYVPCHLRWRQIGHSLHPVYPGSPASSFPPVFSLSLSLLSFSLSSLFFFFFLPLSSPLNRSISVNFFLYLTHLFFVAPFPFFRM
jgi:hypothetical protein